MEAMVTNRDIQKVAIIIDHIYAEKADKRSGGVGTETQIISKEVYDKAQQDKFVAVVTEKYGSSTLNRDHEHHRSTRRSKAREGRPRRLGGVQRGGGT